MAQPRTPGADTSTSRRVKDPAIETLRGLAIVLVVVGHVIGIDAARGMQVAPDSSWRMAYLAFVDIRLPLFTVISGYIYAMRPLPTVGGLPALVKTKARRLLLPLVTVGTILFFTQMVIPGTTMKPQARDYYRIFVFGYEHLWFLQAIFLIFMIAGVLDVLGALDTLRGALLTLALSLILFEVVPIPREADVFSISGVLRLLPYFFLGCILWRYPLRNGRATALAVPVLMVAYAVRFTTILGERQLNPYLDRLVSASIGFTAILCLFGLRRWLRIRPLIWIGGFAFGIYLLHPLGAAAARILLHADDVTANIVVFVAAVCAGLAWPVLFEVSTRRSRVIRTFVLGEKWESRPRR